MFSKVKHKLIGDKAFYQALLVLIIPMIIQQGITSFVSLLDNVMVGRLGTESMSGVAIVNQLLFVFNLTIFGGLAGASIFGAQFYGKGDHDGVRYAFRFKIIFGVLVTAVATGMLLLFNEPLIGLFLTDTGSGGDLALTLSESKKYLNIMLIGLLPFAFSQTYSSTLRETGETVAPMIASTIAIFVNLILNYILIFGNFGAPKMGVAGAAIATVIARYIEAFFLMYVTHANQSRFEFIIGAYNSLKIPVDIVKRILITASPLIANEVLWSIGTTMINQSYSTRGLTVVAATNITSTVWNLFCVVFFAMGNAISIKVGQLLGAGKIEEAKDTDAKLLFFTFVFHIFVGILVAVTAPYIPLIYNTEQVVRDLTTDLLLVAGAALPLHALTHGMYFTLRSGGKTFITFLFDCVFTWVVSLPIAFCLSRFTAVSVVTIYFCVQFADAIKVVIGGFMLKSGVWANNIVSEK